MTSVQGIRRSLLIIALFGPLYAVAQDAQYWTQQQGAQATLLGGAVLSNTGDQSAFFYNPAAVSFLSNTGITVSANYMYFQWTGLEDGDGLGLDAGGSSVENAPKLIAGSVRLDTTDRWRLSFGMLNNLFGRFDLGQQTLLRAEVDTAYPGKEYVPFLVDRVVESREDLVGIGVSRKLGERTSVGFTLFGSLYSQSYSQRADLSAYARSDSTNQAMPVGAWLRSEEVDMFNFGLITKFGVYHTIGKTPIGLSLTFPRMNLSIGNAGSYYLSLAESGPNTPTRKYFAYGEKIPSIYRTPWMIELGAEHKLGSWTLSGRLLWASGIAAYDRLAITAEQDLARGLLIPPGNGYRRVRSASVPVVNVGVGARYTASTTIDLLMGFRTDNNPLDLDAINPSQDLLATFSTWDLQHYSLGADVHSKRVNLTIGIVYSRGSDSRTFNNAADWLPYLGPDAEVQVNYRYSQLGATFGINYFFLGPAPKEAN